MFKIIVYVLVIIIANTIGAVSGMGGGLIIKPALQLLNMDNVILINFYSSFAVFIISISFTWKQLRFNNRIKMSVAICLSIGSVLDGIIGEMSFKLVHSVIGNSKSVIFQMVLVIISLILSLVLSGRSNNEFNLQGNFSMIIVGLFLGWLATLLGIGGGPINIAFFIFLFGVGIRKATIYSIITILFSHASKLLQATVIGDVVNADTSLLLAIMIAATLGGWLGAKISNLIDEKKIIMIYNVVVIFVLFLDIVNIVKYLV